MKKVVSVSLGSSKRNHMVRVTLLGEEFEISRIGTDGSMDKAVSILKELDGQVDAIGLGGIDVYLQAGHNRYILRDGWRLLQTVKHTPVVDGSGLKNTLERQAVAYLVQQGLLQQGTRVLLVSAMDRFGMAEALAEAGCCLTLGDLMFALGIPVPLRSLDRLHTVAAKLMPIVSRLPFQLIYPTGRQQENHHPAGASRFAKYYLAAEVVAGDYHLIRKHLPQRLNGQLILTNTTTRDDVTELMERGAGMLVTTTPEWQGRTFGTNVMEAVFLALLNKPWPAVTVAEYNALLQQLNWQPKILKLRPASCSDEAQQGERLG
ncbi:hypothetical protein JCM39194_15370 [Desulfotomaculum varum]